MSAGVRETSGGNSIPPEAIDATTLRIGTLPGTHPGGTTLDGDIDELHIFRAALGKEEILRLMERDQWF